MKASTKKSGPKKSSRKKVQLPSAPAYRFHSLHVSLSFDEKSALLQKPPQLQLSGRLRKASQAAELAANLRSAIAAAIEKRTTPLEVHVDQSGCDIDVIINGFRKNTFSDAVALQRVADFLHAIGVGLTFAGSELQQKRAARWTPPRARSKGARPAR